MPEGSGVSIETHNLGEQFLRTPELLNHLFFRAIVPLNLGIIRVGIFYTAFLSPELPQLIFCLDFLQSIAIKNQTLRIKNNRICFNFSFLPKCRSEGAQKFLIKGFDSLSRRFCPLSFEPIVPPAVVGTPNQEEHDQASQDKCAE